jgi:proline iminopeptidase
VHRGWPESELIVVEEEGHGGPVMVDAWCLANTRHADRLEREHLQ